jgi:hypothetical protein
LQPGCSWKRADERSFLEVSLRLAAFGEDGVDALLLPLLPAERGSTQVKTLLARMR